MRKYIFLFFILILFNQANAEGKLRIAVNEDYKPFSFLHENGKVTGFDVDIAEALCHLMQMKCEIFTAPWEDMIPGLIEGRHDAVVASMGKTPEREKLVDFTDKYYHSNSRFISKIDSGISITPKSLKGKIIATPKGTIQSDYVEKHYKNIAVIKLTITTDDVFQMLIKGYADIGLEADFTILEFLKTKAGEDFDFIGKPVLSEFGEAYIAVKKGNEPLKNAFNKAIKEIRFNGTYGKINRKYFPFDIY